MSYLGSYFKDKGFKSFYLLLSVGCCASKLLSSSLKPICRAVAVQQVAVYINARCDCDVRQVTILNHNEFHRLFCQLDARKCIVVQLFGLTRIWHNDLTSPAKDVSLYTLCFHLKLFSWFYSLLVLLLKRSSFKQVVFHASVLMQSVGFFCLTTASKLFIFMLLYPWPFLHNLLCT